jgi:hypothetical protein
LNNDEIEEKYIWAYDLIQNRMPEYLDEFLIKWDKFNEKDITNNSVWKN